MCYREKLLNISTIGPMHYYCPARFANVREGFDLPFIYWHFSTSLCSIVRLRPLQSGAAARARARAEEAVMARKINRLNARAVATITEHGRHADGGGLYLSISPNGGRRWVFLYRWHGKPTEIGFGSARDVTLARARELAGQARANLAERYQSKGRQEALQKALRSANAPTGSSRPCARRGATASTLRNGK